MGGIFSTRPITATISRATCETRSMMASGCSASGRLAGPVTRWPERRRKCERCNSWPRYPTPLFTRHGDKHRTGQLALVLARRIGVRGRPLGRLVGALERWRSRVESLAIELRGWLLDHSVDDRSARGGAGSRFGEGSCAGRLESQNPADVLADSPHYRAVFPGIFHGSLRRI